MEEYDGISPWHCAECGHDHQGLRLAYICIGCPCGCVPDVPDCPHRRRVMWTLVDSRTGKRATVASYFTEAQAQRSLDDVRRRVESGKRYDLAEVLPHLSVIEQ